MHLCLFPNNSQIWKVSLKCSSHWESLLTSFTFLLLLLRDKIYLRCRRNVDARAYVKTSSEGVHHTFGASSMIWRTHNTLLQSDLSAPPVPHPLPSTNVITYCSGSRLITLYPVYHAVREVGVHGIWQTHLNTTRVQRQIKAPIQKIPADQVAIRNSQAVSQICHEVLCRGSA